MTQPSVFRQKAVELFKQNISEAPAGTTGYLSSLDRHIANTELALPISFNGQNTKTPRLKFDNANSGMVAVIRDSKGGREPQTILNFRSSQLLTSSDGGKLSISGTTQDEDSEEKSEFIQIDMMHIGQKFDAGCAVSLLRMTGAHDSTNVTKAEAEENWAPFDPTQGSIIDPNTGKPVSIDEVQQRASNFIGPTIAPTNNQSKIDVLESLRNRKNVSIDILLGLPDISEALKPLVKTQPTNQNLEYVFNFKTGKVELQRKRDRFTPQGTNARTGTVNFSLNDLLPTPQSLGGF